MFEVDSDENLESYYNYAVEIVSFFYMVRRDSNPLIAVHQSADLAVLP